MRKQNDKTNPFYVYFSCPLVMDYQHTPEHSVRANSQKIHAPPQNPFIRTGPPIKPFKLPAMAESPALAPAADRRAAQKKRQEEEARAQLIKSRKPRTCPAEKPNWNPVSNRCLQSCKPGRSRDRKTFKCVYNPAPEHCRGPKPDYNPNTRRCLKVCPEGLERDPKTHRCVPSSKPRKCPENKPDFNPKTRRCSAPCKKGKTRNAETYKCVKA